MTTILELNLLPRLLTKGTKSGDFTLLLFLTKIPTPIPKLLLSVRNVLERTVTLLLLLVVLCLHRCALTIALMNGLAPYMSVLGIGRMLRRVHNSMAGVLTLMTPELTIL